MVFANLTNSANKALHVVKIDVPNSNQLVANASLISSVSLMMGAVKAYALIYSSIERQDAQQMMIANVVLGA